MLPFAPEATNRAPVPSGALDPEKDAGDLAFGSGQDLGAAGGWFGTAGAREGLRQSGKRRADFLAMSPLVTKPDGRGFLRGFRPDQHGKTPWKAVVERRGGAPQARLRG